LMAASPVSDNGTAESILESDPSRGIELLRLAHSGPREVNRMTPSC